MYSINVPFICVFFEECFTVAGVTQDVSTGVTTDSLAFKRCKFPFIYKGKTYNGCTTIDENKSWCFTNVDGNNMVDWNGNNHVEKMWGYCNQFCPVEGKNK